MMQTHWSITFCMKRISNIQASYTDTFTVRVKHIHIYYIHTHSHTLKSLTWLTGSAEIHLARIEWLSTTATSVRIKPMAYTSAQQPTLSVAQSIHWLHVNAHVVRDSQSISYGLLRIRVSIHSTRYNIVYSQCGIMQHPSPHDRRWLPGNRLCIRPCLNTIAPYLYTYLHRRALRCATHSNLIFMYALCTHSHAHAHSDALDRGRRSPCVCRLSHWATETETRRPHSLQSQESEQKCKSWLQTPKTGYIETKIKRRRRGRRGLNGARRRWKRQRTQH